MFARNLASIKDLVFISSSQFITLSVMPFHRSRDYQFFSGMGGFTKLRDSAHARVELRYKPCDIVQRCHD